MAARKPVPISAERRARAYESLGRLIAAWAREFYPSGTAPPLVKVMGGKGIVVHYVYHRDTGRLARIGHSLGLDITAFPGEPR